MSLALNNWAQVIQNFVLIMNAITKRVDCLLRPICLDTYGKYYACKQPRFRSACAHEQSDDRCHSPGVKQDNIELWGKKMCSLIRDNICSCDLRSLLAWMAVTLLQIWNICLTIKMPRKLASENAVCWTFLQTFQIYVCIQANSVDPEEQSDLDPHCLQKWLLKSQADDKAIVGNVSLRVK